MLSGQLLPSQVEEGESETKGHHQLHSNCQASLGYKAENKILFLI